MRTPYKNMTFTITSLIVLMATPIFAQNGLGDLLGELDLKTVKKNRQWKLDDGQLVFEGKPSLLIFSRNVTGSYALTLEFTRESGEGGINVILPVGKSQCSLNMSLLDGQAHGIAIVNGKLARENETTILPGRLENGHPYRLQIEVKPQGDSVSIDSKLDGKQFLKWFGKQTSLRIVDQWKVPEGNKIGLICFNNKTTFHKAALGQAGMMAMTPQSKTLTKAQTTSSKVKTILFEKRTWIIDNAKSVKVENYKGKTALHVTGREKAFVYLKDAKFQDGTIEVDIASETFSGIGFHGNQNGTQVEKLYFRPFNSGTAKHENSVQYSMLGNKDAHWRTLRKKFPGKYESGANLKSNEWFHARIMVKGKRMEAFVNDEKVPVLEVAPLLQDSNNGTLGVWSWNGYFANFQFTPRK